MRNALGFLQAKGFDERQQNSIKVTRVLDGAEPVEFKALFNRWPDVPFDSKNSNSNSLNAGSNGNGSNGTVRSHNINSVAKTITTYFDASLLHTNTQLASESQMVDDGRGFKEIWFVQNFEIQKLAEAKHGEFYSGDCYIIHYHYKVKNSDKHILYYWIVSLQLFLFYVWSVNIFAGFDYLKLSQNKQFQVKIFRLNPL
jgi:hypothetical protein